MKKVLAIIGVSVLLALTALPLFALDVALSIDVVLVSDDPPGVTASITTERQYSTGNITTVYTSNPISLVYVNEENLMGVGIKATLSENGRAEYTGYLVSIQGNESNIIGSFTDLTPDSAGNYYIANDTYFHITSDLQNTAPMIFTPVNINDSIDPNNYGFSAGYNFGKKEQARLDQARIDYLQSQIDYYQASMEERAEDLRKAYNTWNQAQGDTVEYVGDIVSTGINGFSDVIGQFFQLRVLGLTVYQIVLVACLIPLFIFIFKLVVHKNA